MKLKEIKKSKKRQGDVDLADKVVKPMKKAKTNGVAAEENSEEQASVEKSLKSSVDNSIFQHFKELTNEEEATRLNAATQLLQQLGKTKDAAKRQKELAYTLKRLVRGCGASTNTSRAGFYTGLVALLKTFAEVSLEQVFDSMQKELHVGSTIANKEDADAIVGKILVCGALLRAGRTTAANSEYLEQITNNLLQATKHRTYHASLAYSFLIELLETLTEKQFESSIWPLLRVELTKPWPKQTLQTVHCLIAVQQKFPSVVNGKFLKSHFGGAELLNAESFQYLHKIFWEHSNTNILTHPAIELFGAHIASNAKLSEFWTEHVDPALSSPTKLLEIESLKIATDILNNLAVEKTNVVDLLSPNFMKMLVDGLKNLKQKKDETLKAFYEEFIEALVTCCAKLKKDVQKVAVIRTLLLPPGTFSIEKYTNTRIIHQLINHLELEGVKEIFKLYKSIFLGTLAKNVENSSENWLNFERMNAGYMLQHLLAHKAVQNAYKWREEQLRFFLTCGIFNVNEALEVCKKEAAGTFSTDFGEQCKNMFYISLQSKLHDLQEEKQLLLNLVNYCNERLQQKQAAKYLRLKQFDDALQHPWKSMHAAITSSGENAKAKKKKTAAVSDGDKLELVFNILLMNMGLQIFREPEMAAPAIDDLLKCMQRTKEQQQKSGKKKSKAQEENDDEPEWIEVVVDLFLHLLSQNASALRNIVNALFPHLCGSLNLSAIHQILAVLEMKDGHNPLSSKAEDEEEDGEEEENEEENEANVKSDDENESEAENESDNNEVEDDDDEDDDEDEEDDDEEDDEEEADEDDEVTASDKLRNAISQALMDSGAALGPDDDMDSIDLNDMTEEEGQKLDEALANAFKAMKKTSGSGSQSKKSKSYRVKTTTVMHFRIRVLDLIEIYLQQQPTLLISIEIMLALFDMLEFCIGDELKPLQIKVEKVLNKLTALRTYTADADLQESSLVDFIRLIVEKKSPAAVYDVTNKLRNKCIVFLIVNSQKVVADEVSSKVLALCLEYLQEFVRSRNPTVNITLLSDIFKLRWAGVWPLAIALAQQGLTMQTRIFRRIQIYEILCVFYKNNDLQRLKLDKTKKEFKTVEKALLSHIKMLADAATTTTAAIKQSPKEFQTLLECLLHAQKAYVRLNLPATLNSAETCTAIQTIRRGLRLDALQVYQRYCGAFKLPVVRNNALQLNEHKQQNGNGAAVDSCSDTEEQPPAQAQGEGSKKRKEKDLRKAKKQKKQQRMLAASQGLSSSFTFAQAQQQTAPSSDDEESA